MKVQLDCWDIASDGSGFEVDMVCPPRVGETLQIHKSRFPAYYDDMMSDWLCPDGMVRVTVLAVDHLLAEDGRHLVRVDFDIEC